MEIQCLRQQILHTEDAFSVVLAKTKEQIDAACRLRYQVYCVERGFEPGSNGVETDEFDAHARHVLLIHRQSGEVIGTVRVVLPRRSSTEATLPMERVCQPGLLKDLPLWTTGEISRFAVSKQRRMSLGATAMVRLGLMQGIVKVSDELGLDHWCAIMEPFLLRLLQMNAIHFRPLGPLVEYHGMRQPSYGKIQIVLDRIQREQLDVWNYITLGGTLWYGRAEAELVA
jgi:N-acyl-L-homoserine lactone synthetase